MGSETRKKTEHISARATPEEKAGLQERADAFGISLGELVRQTIFGTKPKSKLDQKAIAEMIQTRADLGRLGGLYKAWLAGEFSETSPMPQADQVKKVRELLDEIEKAQGQLILAIRNLTK